MTSSNLPNEIYITRQYDSSIEKVWDAWIINDQVTQWWGPRGFTTTTIRKDVKTSGNWLFTMHRLAEFLEKTKSGKDIFVINRSFDIDLISMYSAWTDTNEIMTWQAPMGMSGRYLQAHIKPDGESFYELTGNGITMYGKAKYLELVKQTLIVYTQVFTDKTGKVSRHPLAPTFPETLKTTISADVR